MRPTCFRFEVAGDAHHQGAEDQGRDDRLDHAQEDLAQHAQVDPDVGPVVPDLRAHDHGDEDPGGQRAAPHGVGAHARDGDPAAELAEPGPSRESGRPRPAGRPPGTGRPRPAAAGGLRVIVCRVPAGPCAPSAARRADRRASTGGRARRCASSADQVLRHHAVVAAVAEVDDQADGQPDEQPLPVLRRQREHQHQAGEDAQASGTNGPSGRAERPLRLGVRAAHDQHGGADDHEGEAGCRCSRGRPGCAAAGGPRRWPRRRRSGSSTSRASGTSGGRRRRSSAGTRPSRAMASNTRGWLSIITRRTEVIPATAPDADQEARPGQAGLAEGVGDRASRC